MATKRRRSRTRITITRLTPEQECDGIPFLQGGARRFALLSWARKLSALGGNDPLPGIGKKRLLKTEPGYPARAKPFSVLVDLPSSNVERVRLDVGMPSGVTRRLHTTPSASERRRRRIVYKGLISQCAGRLYLEARLYLSDGSVRSDAKLTTVFSKNPCRLTMQPRLIMPDSDNRFIGRISDGLVGSVMRCSFTITNYDLSKTADFGTTCGIRYIDYTTGLTVGTENRALLQAITVPKNHFRSFSLTLEVPEGPVTALIDQRHEVAVEVSFTSSRGEIVRDWCLFRRMGTIPIAICAAVSLAACDDYPWDVIRKAVYWASSEWERCGLTIPSPPLYCLYEGERPNFPPSFAIINVGWRDTKLPTPSDNLDWSELSVWRERYSAPDQNRIDVFVAGISFGPGVPSSLLNVAGCSPLNGPFPKDTKPTESGVFIALNTADPIRLGKNLAHEIGHYLGLDHVNIPGNIMLPDGEGPNLQYWQWAIASHHPMVQFSPIQHATFDFSRVAPLWQTADRKKRDLIPTLRKLGSSGDLVGTRVQIEAKHLGCLSGDWSHSPGSITAIDRLYKSKHGRTVLLKMLSEADSPESAGLRLSAARILTSIGEKSAVRALKRLALDRKEYPELRLEAVRGLFALGATLSSFQLRQLVDEPNTIISQAAIAGALGSPRHELAAWGATRFQVIPDDSARREILRRSGSTKVVSFSVTGHRHQ
jgi:hypothetical protein